MEKGIWQDLKHQDITLCSLIEGCEANFDLASWFFIVMFVINLSLLDGSLGNKD